MKYLESKSRKVGILVLLFYLVTKENAFYMLKQGAA